MNKLAQLLLGLVATSFLLGCEISIKDGIVPAEHVESAMPYTGGYSGTFEGVEGHMELDIGSDGMAVLKFYDADLRSDILPGCGSEIRLLTSVGIDEKAKLLELARFDLSPGRCERKIIGREVVLIFKDPSQFEVKIAKSGHWERGPIRRICSGSRRRRHCHNLGNRHYVIDSYLTGQFSKQ